MMKERIENIQEQEESLDKIDSFIEKLEEVADAWEKIQPNIKSISDYYSSKQWMEDYDAYNNGELPKMKCGVLSEDAIYNTLYKMRCVSIQLMKTAIEVIEQ